MSAPRFHLPHDAGALVPGAEVTLPDDEAHHARSVLRLRDGDAILLFDGAGLLAEATLIHIDKRSVHARVNQITRREPSVPHCTIAFAPPKGKRAAVTVEKLTELGADELIPLETARGVSEGGDLDKWHERAVEACKQCIRADVPVVRDLRPIAELARSMGEWDCALVASLAPGARSGDGLTALLSAARRVLWIVGPEGGFTPEEEEMLCAAGAVPVRIAPHVLRIGTAAELCAGLTRFLTTRA